MKIAIITDAWLPQINGVVTTILRTKEELERIGHTVHMVTPQGFRTVPMPTYPDIRLSLFPGRKVRAMLDALQPDSVHISTEGPLGIAARAWCIKRNFPYTTSFHTQFPEYVWLRTRLPLTLSYAVMRWFHGRALYTLVATSTLHERLKSHGFTNLAYWSRGVDTKLFRPRDKAYIDAPRPVFMYMGRVAIEKNIEAFLSLDLPGTKYVVGAGPDLAMLRQKYPAVRFTGYKADDELAQYVAAADVFVFPSRTDTFGLVVIEALASGVPVAAFPVQGPVDIIENGVTGYVDEDLRAAALHALELDPGPCRTHALGYTWERCTRQLLPYLEEAQPKRTRAAVPGTPEQPASR